MCVGGLVFHLSGGGQRVLPQLQCSPLPMYTPHGEHGACRAGRLGFVPRRACDAASGHLDNPLGVATQLRVHHHLRSQVAPRVDISVPCTPALQPPRVSYTGETLWTSGRVASDSGGSDGCGRGRGALDTAGGARPTEPCRVSQSPASVAMGGERTSSSTAASWSL